MSQNTTKPPPGTTAAEVRMEIIRVLTDKSLTARRQRKCVAEVVLKALMKRGQLYYHAELRDFGSALYFDGPSASLESIRSDFFRADLAAWTGINRADPLFAAIGAEIETAALSEVCAKAILPEAFWARREDRIYLSNGDSAICRISPGKVELVPNGTDDVLFPIGRTLKPWELTEPLPPWDTCRLFKEIQAEARNASVLSRLWLLSLPTNPTWKPPLCIAGEIGSGKTRLALGIAEVYGLPLITAKVEERLEGDFWPTVDAGGLFVLDNADTRTRWLADAVAAAATGIGVSRRRLYTDKDIVPLRARAWLCLTTSNPTFASDPGLADRLLVVRLQRRQGTTADAILSREIAENRNAALSFIAQTLAAALADSAPVPDNLNARHPDFAAFAVRVGRALGAEAEAIAALSQAEADKSLFCLQNDTLGAGLLTYVVPGTVLHGDAYAVRSAVSLHDPSLSNWSNKSIGRKLSALWPHIEAVFEATRAPQQGQWIFTIKHR